MLDKSKTRKGGLGKNEHPDGLTTFKGNSGKKQGHQKTIPRWIENPKGRSRQKWDDEKWKNMQKHWPQRRCQKHLRDCSNKQQYPSNYFTASCLQRWSRRIFKRRRPQKRNFRKYVSEREPLCAQHSNVLSVSAKLCLQIANHHAFQNIHTCIIMHLTCSCMW